MKWRNLAAGGLLACAAAAAYLTGAQIFRPHAELISPRSQALAPAEIGAWGPVLLAFDRPMQADSVTKAFTFDPAVPFSTQWQGQSLRITPSQAFKQGITYTARLAEGALSLDGSAAAGLQFSFQIRPAWVVYLSPVRGPHELWRAPLGGGQAQQMTSTGGKVIDFSVSHDGDRLIYAVRNAQNGSDIWSAGRDGSDAKLWVACGMDTCSAASLSPDGSQLAYIRAAGYAEAGKPGRVYTADAGGGAGGALDADASILGLQPSWSPDGIHLAYYESGLERIRVIDVRTGGEIFVQSGLPGGVSWSPDGAEMLFNDTTTTGAQPYSSVVAFDFAKRQASVLIGGSEDVVDAGLPAWSPLGNQLLVGLRQVGGAAARQLWLIHPDGTPLKQITDDPLTNAAAYAWDPWGDAVVYQTYSLADLDSNPHIVVWDSASGQMRTLSTDGALPQMLP